MAGRSHLTKVAEHANGHPADTARGEPRFDTKRKSWAAVVAKAGVKLD